MPALLVSQIYGVDTGYEQPSLVSVWDKPLPALVMLQEAGWGGIYVCQAAGDRQADKCPRHHWNLFCP